jgi:hypothetical protein
MAQLALGAAAAGVGFLVGGPAGASIGWAVGAAAGGYLFAESSVAEGPRLQELRVQTSALGLPVALLVGTVRAAGNVIDISELRETRSEEDVGGKGGPSNTQVTYSYEVDVDIALGEALLGPIVGVRRIWANGQLVYDVGSTASAGALFVSAEFARGLVVYPGSTDQLPDPTFEALRGVGAVPAYRGLAHAVISGLRLEQYGRALPNLEFEVVCSGAPVGPARLTDSPTLSPSGPRGTVLSEPHYLTGLAGGVIRRWRAGRVDLYALDGTYLGDDEPSDLEAGLPADWGPITALDNAKFSTPLAEGGALYLQNGVVPAPGETTAGRLFVQGAGGSVDVAGPWVGRNLVGVAPCHDNVHFVVLHLSAANADPRYDLCRWTGREVEVLRSGASDHPVPGLLGSGVGYGRGSNLITAGGNWTPSALALEPGLQHVWLVQMPIVGFTYSVRVFAIDEAGELRLVHTFSEVFASDLTYIDWSPTVIADAGLCAVAVGVHVYVYSRADRLAPAQPLLADVVAGLGARVGLPGAQLDVSLLSGTVDGLLANRAGITARGVLEALRSVHFFDARESADRLQFVPRGGAAVATLGSADLAAPDEATGAAWAATRSQWSELPQRLTVRYLARDAAYVPGAQTAVRGAAATGVEAELELPLALADQAAADVAARLLYDLWVGRTERRFATSRRWAHLEPADPLVFAPDGVTVRLRITEQRVAAGVCEFTAVDEEAATYAITGAAQATPFAPTSLEPAGPTRLALLDIPMLRDGDDDAGLYVAAGGYAAAWSGASLWRSADEGATWQAVERLGRGTPIGTTETALPAAPVGAVWDLSSVLEVRLPATAVLASAAEATVYAGANALAVGGEVLQYAAAESLGAGRWRLTRLLRARRGTELEAAVSKAAGARVVVLDAAALVRVECSLADRGRVLHWRAASDGQPLLDAPVQRVAHQAVGLRPYPPVQLRAARLPSGDVLIGWEAQSRLGEGWLDGADAPLGESSEAYRLEILQSPAGPVLRSFDVAGARSQTYASASVVADFGAAPAALTVRVAQVSEQYGAGAPAQETLSLLRSGEAPAAVLLHLNGSLDSAGQFAVAPVMRAGTAAYDTVNKVFGSASLACNGSTMCAEVPYIAELNLSATDFTIEAWLSRDVVAGNKPALAQWDGAATSGRVWRIRGTGANPGGIVFEYQTESNTTKTLTGPNNITASATAFSHVAVVRSGTSLVLYVGGVAVAAAFEPEALKSATMPLTLGAVPFGAGATDYQAVKIDELRVVRAAMYSGAFSPPAAEFSF